MEKTDILSMNKEELTAYIVSLGEPKFRATQIWGWLLKGADFSEMKNLPAALRAKLEENAFVATAKPVRKLVSKEGTIKYLYELHDGEKIESVLMRYKHGNTICISTEAGCPMGCAFCASTLKGLSRRLLPSEMLSQIISTQKDTGERVDGIVLMGIGEPLDNYDNVLKFLRLVGSPEGLNIGYRHISLSTCGLVDRIGRLAEENGIKVTRYTNSSYTDVVVNKDTNWYTPYVEWATRNGIVEGHGDGTFGPDEEITHEQMYVIMYRYTLFVENISTGNVSNVSINSITDRASISDWALNAVKYAYKNDFVIYPSSTSKKIAPQGAAKRSELAMLLEKYCVTILGRENN